MYIESLRLENFRSYAEGVFTPASGINLLYGGNAQGKTNLLEAIYYSSCVRSFRASSDAELVRMGAQNASVRVKACGHGRTLETEIRFGARRELFINGIRQKRAADFIGSIACVLFCPEDLYLVRDGAQARRKFMDTALSQLRPGYAALLTEYNRLLAHKTRILRDYHEKPSLLEPLDEFSHRLCEVGARIIPYRHAFCAALAREASALHGEISGGTEKLNTVYRTVSTVTDTSLPASAQASLLWEHYTSHKQAELACGSCLTGIHKDDIDITLDGLSAKTYASQGQTRTAALAMKLAERRLFHIDSGEYPVLLLDDVLSELDRKRQDYILHGIREGQVFITSCERHFAEQLQELACETSGCGSFGSYYIENSVITPS